MNWLLLAVAAFLMVWAMGVANLALVTDAKSTRAGLQVLAILLSFLVLVMVGISFNY